MSNNSLLLTDPDFNISSTENCHLLLKITNDSFSYAIVDKISGAVNVIFDQQGCEDVVLTLKNAFNNDINLSKSYSLTKASVHTSHFTFIPNDWFDVSGLSDYEKFIGTGNNIKANTDQGLGFTTVFSIEKKITGHLPDNTVLYPQSSPLLALKQHLTGNGLLIDFTANSFNVLLIHDDKVQFQNHYESESPEEFNYFLLLMMEQLNLTESVPVYLQGIINEDDDYYNTLLKYFNNLYFFLPAGQQDSELLADMPKHYFSGLLALDLCE